MQLSLLLLKWFSHSLASNLVIYRTALIQLRNAKWKGHQPQKNTPSRAKKCCPYPQRLMSSTNFSFFWHKALASFMNAAKNVFSDRKTDLGGSGYISTFQKAAWPEWWTHLCAIQRGLWEAIEKVCRFCRSEDQVCGVRNTDITIFITVSAFFPLHSSTIPN